LLAHAGKDSSRSVRNAAFLTKRSYRERGSFGRVGGYSTTLLGVGSLTKPPALPNLPRSLFALRLVRLSDRGALHGRAGGAVVLEMAVAHFLVRIDDGAHRRGGVLRGRGPRYRDLLARAGLQGGLGHAAPDQHAPARKVGEEVHLHAGPGRNRPAVVDGRAHRRSARHAVGQVGVHFAEGEVGRAEDALPLHVLPVAVRLAGVPRVRLGERKRTVQVHV